jgi:4-hydroxy-2-oxoheptanedioate aldolase
MMRPSRIKAKLRRNEAALITCLHFTDPTLYEMTSLLGFDGIWMDLEHHHYSVETAANLMRAARVGTSDIVARPAKGEFMRMGRLLEAGAQAIMYPRCDSADEAREVVRWAKFAPLGERGVDAANADAPYCFAPLQPYLNWANEETLVVIQVESPEAIDAIDEIAAVPGVDVIMLGPGDLSVLWGIPGQLDHPVIKHACVRISEATRKAGIHWGTVSRSTEHTKQLMNLGARFICNNADILMMKNALEEMQKNFTALGFTFENRIKTMLDQAPPPNLSTAQPHYLDQTAANTAA